MSVQSLNKTIACAFALFLSLSAPVLATEGGGDASWRAGFENPLILDLTERVPRDIWTQIISMDENAWKDWRYVSKFYNEKYQGWKNANQKNAPWQKWNLPPKASCDIHLQDRDKSWMVNIGNKVYFQWDDTSGRTGQYLACLELDPKKEAYSSEKDVKRYKSASGFRDPDYWITNLFSHHGQLYLVYMNCQEHRDYPGSLSAQRPHTLASQLIFNAEDEIELSHIPLTEAELRTAIGDSSYSGRFRYASCGSKLICTFTCPEWGYEPTEEQLSHLAGKVIVFDSEENTKQIMDADLHQPVQGSTYIPYVLTRDQLATGTTRVGARNDRRFIETDRYVYFYQDVAFSKEGYLHWMDKTDYTEQTSKPKQFCSFFAQQTVGSALLGLTCKQVDGQLMAVVIVHDPKTNKLYSRNLYQQSMNMNYFARVLFDGERLWVLNFECDGQNGLNLKTIQNVDLDPHILLLLNPNAKQADIL